MRTIGRLRLLLSLLIAPGTLPSTPFRFVPSGPNVYFPANDGTHGFELWAMPRMVLGSTFGDVPTDYWAFLWIEALVDAGITVPPSYWAAAWIDQLVADGVTSGCGNGDYCPDRPVTRAEMAVLLARMFELATP